MGVAPGNAGDALDALYWRRMWLRPRKILVALFAVLAGGSTGSAHALGPKDRRLTSARAGITIEAPAGWMLSQHTGYRETVALMLHPDGSRISVTAAPTDARDASALFEQSRRGLTAQGLTLARSGPGPRGSVLVDAIASGRNEAIRQLYLVRNVPRGRQAVVLTLVCRTPLLASHGAALDLSLARLGLETPLDPASSASARGEGRSSGGSGGSAAEPGPPALDRNPGSQEAEKR
jgi:hypothetical protein